MAAADGSRQPGSQLVVRQIEFLERGQLGQAFIWQGLNLVARKVQLGEVAQAQHPRIDLGQAKGIKAFSSVGWKIL